MFKAKPGSGQQMIRIADFNERDSRVRVMSQVETAYSSTVM